MNVRSLSVILLILAAVFLILYKKGLLTHMPTATKYVTVTKISEEAFRSSCESRGGIYNEPSIFFGVGPVQIPSYCGFEKASDGGRLCSSQLKKEKLLGDCSLCTYRATCRLAAGDFGPEHCSCAHYAEIESNGK